jgi:hypothetical protein
MIIPFTNTAATRMVSLEEMAFMCVSNLAVGPYETAGAVEVAWIRGRVGFQMQC